MTEVRGVLCVQESARTASLWRREGVVRLLQLRVPGEGTGGNAGRSELVLVPVMRERGWS
jgi:hypothetical protein